jgi:hypothetical protein
MIENNLDPVVVDGRSRVSNSDKGQNAYTGSEPVRQ